MMSEGSAKKISRKTNGGPVTSQRVTLSARGLITQEASGVVAPGHAHRVADLEEGGAAGGGIGQQGLDARSVGQLHDVGRDVADVEKLPHPARELIFQVVMGLRRADAHLLG